MKYIYLQNQWYAILSSSVISQAHYINETDEAVRFDHIPNGLPNPICIIEISFNCLWLYDDEIMYELLTPNKMSRLNAGVIPRRSMHLPLQPFLIPEAGSIDVKLTRINGTGYGGGLVNYSYLELQKIDAPDMIAAGDLYFSDIFSYNNISYRWLSQNIYRFDLDAQAGTEISFHEYFDHYSIDEILLYCNSTNINMPLIHFKTRPFAIADQAWQYTLIPLSYKTILNDEHLHFRPELDIISKEQPICVFNSATVANSSVTGYVILSAYSQQQGGC